MANYKETNSYNSQVDELTEVLATARRMQQDWLKYGVDYVHLYIEDVDSDWLESWRDEEILTSFILDKIKEFLVSDDPVAKRLRQHLGERSLFEIAVNLEECWHISSANERLTAVKHLLADTKTSEIEISNLAASLLQRISEIL
ncbi:hypothetical protein NOS3756_52680 [Nostoc sp. NIES-3756]|uniref:hypothetical protein n=1 Tax=Nostoc sp. NIES-3756 TaxID=1751286 RepID=UPI000722937A|nr:hypothetical protein [Nostoc sp. NIES-3756]BAT56265.1 hypothetical protein NOS3756_52680 [Nostoc sp. NIES-3756]